MHSIGMRMKTMRASYCRALKPVRCKSCGHKGYDADFERHEFKEVAECSFEVIIVMDCPSCLKEVEIEYLDK